MTEILTESFCERCGTRYTFESARPKARLKSMKVLSRGLKNFVLSDDTSIDEAMAAARSETDREATSHQLDAFHKTFNFCMSCRQYTCPNCWNESEARCLSCAPLAMPEPATPIEDLRRFGTATLVDEPAWTNGAPVPADEPWSIPGQVDPEPAWAQTTEAVADDSIEAETAAAADLPVAGAPVAEPLEAAEGGTDDLEPEAADAAGKAAAQTTGLLRRFRPGQSLDDELDAYERQRTVTGATDGLAATPDVPETIAASEALAAEATGAETAQADLVPAAEPEAVEAAPPAEPLTAAPATASGADVVEQPTWRITQPDEGSATPPSATPDPGAVPLQANGAPPEAVSAEPQWPTRPEWPTRSEVPSRSEWPVSTPISTPTAGLPFLGRPAAPQGGIEALWAASNQEIVTAVPAPGRAASGIQPCISCGLSLSATARFCRRCGTLQNR